MQKIILLPFTPNILRQFSLFLQANHFPTYFLCKIGYSILPRPVQDPLRPPRTPSPKSGSRDTPNQPGLTPMRTVVDSIWRGEVTNRVRVTYPPVRLTSPSFARRRRWLN